MAVQDYLDKYEKLFSTAQGYDVNKFQSTLEKAYNEKQNYNKDLIGQQNALQQESIALPAQLRQEYMGSPIRDALAQEALIASRRQGIGTQLGTVTDLLNARGQQFSDILGKATSAYQTDAQRAQQAAENAWRLYQDQVQQNQFSRSLRGSGGGSGLDMETIKRAQQVQALSALSDKIAEVRLARGQGKLGQSIDSIHSQLLNWAGMNAIPISSEDLWVALGNKPKTGYKTSKSYADLLKTLR